MDTIIRKIPQRKKLDKKIRVAAYARVSSGKDTMLHSLSYQVSYYSSYIQNHSGWLFAGIYADEAKTGTKDTRENFQRLLNDCRAGNIDMVITKSVSRFARNTVTVLQTIRELNQLQIDVYFEEQKIHTLSSEGEFLLTVLASYAEQEALSVGENMRWRVRKNFEEGKEYSLRVLGYDLIDGKLVVNKKEAEIIKLIYEFYLNGMGFGLIASTLNSMGLKNKLGLDFKPNGISKTLRNVLYTGDLLLQKTFRAPLTKVTIQNKGQMPQYKVEDAHEPIIDRETFNKVQAEIKRRKVQYERTTDVVGLFSNLIICGCCGRHLVRSVCNVNPAWICSLYKSRGKKACQSQAIPEKELIRITKDILNVEELNPILIKERIKSIISKDEQILIFNLNNGLSLERKWNVRSRKESWTPEMKQKMSDLKKGIYYAKSNSNTIQS